jgi:endonuclease/exonuclease/phosphatase family metal-dependent hydrolase
VRSLRIVTLNTAKNDPPYARRLELMADGLVALEPDVVALQESFLSIDRSCDTGGFLAERLGMRQAWSPARWKERQHEGTPIMSASGLALLTRRPLVDCATMELPCDPRDGERIGQIGLLCTGDALVTIANVHLTHLRDADALRREQMATLLAHEWLARPVAARLVCGDFNLEHARLTELFPPDDVWRFADSFELGGGQLPRATVRDKCIDFVLLLARDGEDYSVFAESRVVLGPSDPKSDVLPSDHKGVLTTLRVP